MKAIVHETYGTADEVLELRDVEPPVMGEREVLVRVHAASVHPDVWHVVTGLPYALRLMGAGIRRPKIQIPGTDMAGRVEAVGKHVTRFRVGDEVFGEVVAGHPWMHGGAFAEFVAVREAALEHKPVNVTFEQAASVPTSGLIALRTLRAEGKLQAGQRVLINGAGGGVGMMAVQIAKALGAHVCGVDHPLKREFLYGIGVDDFVDYTQEDFTQGEQRFDLFLDVASNLTLAGCKKVLTEHGIYVLVGHTHFDEAHGRWFGSLGRFFGLTVWSLFDRHLPAPNFSMGNTNALGELRELMERGQLAPVVDRTYPLSDVREAIRHLKEGHPRGKIVLKPSV